MDFAGRCLGGIRLAARQADLDPPHRAGTNAELVTLAREKVVRPELCAESALKEPIVHITVSQPWRQPVGGRPSSEWLSHCLGTETLPGGRSQPRPDAGQVTRGRALKVRFAVSLDAGRVEPGHLASLVTGAEERGVRQSSGSWTCRSVNVVDPTVAVAFAAGLSRRLRLGVDLVPFGYESFVVARQLAQLDQLTDGRLLVTVVPGLDLPGERAALGIAGRDRGHLLDSLLPELRTWWAGSPVTVGQGEATAEVTLPGLPRQDPLEIWLGGHGPRAVRRPAGSPTGLVGGLLRPPRGGRGRCPRHRRRRRPWWAGILTRSTLG